MHLTLQELTKSGFLAFLRLVGCAYFKKHRNAFPGVTSESLFHSLATVQSEVEQFNITNGLSTFARKSGIESHLKMK